jgi:ribosomal protein S27AE
MEKYGVTEPERTEKIATPTNACPICGSKLEKHGELLKCPQCGTKPFEQKPK